MPFHFVTTIQKIDLRYFLCFDRTNKSYVLKGIVKFFLIKSSLLLRFLEESLPLSCCFDSRCPLD